MIIGETTIRSLRIAKNKPAQMNGRARTFELSQNEDENLIPKPIALLPVNDALLAVVASPSFTYFAPSVILLVSVAA